MSNREEDPQPTATSSSDTAGGNTKSNAKSNTDDDAPTTNALGEPIVKRKVCVLFGYVGERYCGLQYVKETHINTVERELLNGFMRAGYLSEVNVESSNPMQKVGWERASRTDKGVHALKNLISLKLQIPVRAMESNDFSTCVAAINKELPNDIRIYKIQPVTGSFNAYLMCHGRRYQYYLPTFALCSKAEYDAMLPHDVAPQYINDGDADTRAGAEATVAEDGSSDGQANVLGGKRGRTDNDAEDTTEVTPADASEAINIHISGRGNKDIKYGNEPMNVYRAIPADTMRRLAQYRIGADGLERARKLFNMYVGTLPYHNFTPGGKAADKSTIRYIQRVTVNEPEVLMPSVPADSVAEEGAEEKQQHFNVCYPNGLEWVRVEIEGQSFMLNQIRKMIGNVVCAMVLGLPDYFVSDALQTNVVRGIPMAPANGLFLSYLDFAVYNKKLATMRQQQGPFSVALSGKTCVDMDFDVAEIDGKLKESDTAAYDRLVQEQIDTRAEVMGMHKQILATVGRRECSEDIMGRWLRSARHVGRLCYRMEFGPDDDPLRYEKAPEPMASRTDQKKGFRAEKAALAASSEVMAVPSLEEAKV